MSQKHIVEIRGGPYDGGLIDLAETAYQPRDPIQRAWQDGVFQLTGVPVYTDSRGRNYINWADVEKERALTEKEIHRLLTEYEALKRRDL